MRRLLVLTALVFALPAYAAPMFVPLGGAPAGGKVGSTATAVSADGSTVVGWSDPGGGAEAFLWTSSGGMVGLGDLPGGEFGSFANAVSGDGFRKARFLRG